MIWFTSDTHYGHANIIKYCDRPFNNVDEMNEVLIANHNSSVGKQDLVYHLGDFSFGDQDKYLSRLNGFHYLIKGNHDYRRSASKKWVWVKDTAMISYGEGNFLWLSHYCHAVWNRSHHGVKHFHGHTHGKFTGPKGSFDVGVDAHNYSPVSLEQALEACG